MKKYIKSISLFTVFLISLFSLLSNPLSKPQAVDCSDTNMGGDYTVSTSCAFASDSTTTTVADSSTNANTGTPTGTTIVAGKYGSARSFNGTSDYITVADDNSLDIGSKLTITGWFKVTDTTTTRTIIAKESEYLIRFNTDDTFNLYLYDGADWEPHLTAASNPSAGEWHHFAVVYDSTLGTKHTKIYLDGILSIEADRSITTSATTNPVYIGSRTTNDYFSGTIDDLRIYDYARSETQITEDIDNGSITGSAPIAHWRMDDGYINGVDNGDLTIAADQTLTINAGNTVVWNPGKSITVNGSIAINTTGQLKQGYLWVSDPDADGWYYDSNQVIADSQPTGYIRRKDAIGSVFGDGSDGAVTFNTNTNTNTTAVATGRTVADGISGAVSSIGTNTVTFADFVSPDGWWKMDETADNSCSGGEDVCDSSGNNANGTAYGGASIVSGKYGNARNFDGNDDYVSIPDNALFEFAANQSFTIMLWYNGNYDSTANQALINKGYHDTSQNCPWYFVYIPSSDKAGWWSRDSGCGTNITVAGSTDLTNGVWHHVAVVKDGPANNLKIYVDGGSPEVNTGISDYAIAVNTDPMIFMQHYNDPTFGKLDDVRIFRSALTQTAIENHMNNSTLPLGISTGDVVLLTNLQGDATNYGNVGNYEFLKVASVSSNTITFTTNIQNIYGATSSNSDLTGQKVILQRVPQYSNVTVNDGVTVTGNSWDGTKGGVFAMKANGTLTLNSGAYGGGIIDMNAKGYRGANNV